MSKNLLQNPKAALGFAAVTLVSAMTLVGTSDNNGMLPKLAQRFGSAPPAAQPSEAAVETPPPPPAKKEVPGWYDSPASTSTAQASVFGDYGRETLPAGSAPEPIAPTPNNPFEASSTQPAPSGKPGSGPMNAPISPTAVLAN